MIETDSDIIQSRTLNANSEACLKLFGSVLASKETRQRSRVHLVLKLPESSGHFYV